MNNQNSSSLFDKFLEFSDVTSVFKVLSRTEYIILWKIIQEADNGENDGKVYLEKIKKNFNAPMVKVSEIVREMSEEGWLLWKLDSHNKKTYVEVTSSGREKCEQQRKGMKKIRDRIEEEISEEDKKVFLSVLDTYGRVIREEVDQTEEYFNLILGKNRDTMNIISILKPKNTVTYVYDTDSLEEVLSVIRKSGFATIPVIDRSGKYAGTISEGDMLWYIDKKGGLDALKTSNASDIVNKTRNPAVKDMVNNKTLIDGLKSQNFLCMVDDRNCFIGIITRKELLKYFEEYVQRRQNRG